MELGLIDGSGNFSKLQGADWRNETGNVCVKLILKGRGGGWSDMFGNADKSPALLQVYLEKYDASDGSWNKIHTWYIHLLNQIFEYGSNAGISIAADETFEIIKDMYNNYLEIGTLVPRNVNADLRISFRATYNPVTELMAEYTTWGTKGQTPNNIN